MTVRGKIKNGKVVLDDPKALPEGTEVEVRPLKKGKPATATKARPPKKSKPAGKPRKPKERPRSLADRLRSVIGKATGLPPDASVNYDHYLYGLPKQE